MIFNGKTVKCLILVLTVYKADAAIYDFADLRHFSGLFSLFWVSV